MQYKIVISHPTGNANVRRCVNGLYKANMLHSFHTSIACFPNTIFYKVGVGPLAFIKKRTYSSFLRKFTKVYPIKEILRNLKKFGVSVDDVYHDLDNKVANCIQKHSHEITAVYAYDEGAYIQFSQAKKEDIKCLFDLPIIHWRTYQKLLQNEKNKNPAWASSLGTTFSDSKEKLARKDEELRMADHIFVASSFTKRSIEEDFPYKHAPISVIPYGFPNVFHERKYIPTEDRKLKFLFVGRLTQTKGLSYMFEALNGFENEINLTLIGDNTYANVCPALKSAINKYQHIPYLPHDEILKMMREFDVLIFPSLFEGFGLVITEAMSQGTPVLTTNRTCGNDFIKDGDNGWIVESANTKALQNKIKEIIQNRSQLATIGKRAMDTASQRPWAKYEEELSEAIKKVIEVK
jgi:glycosyltransferase involved in cell wall biosynthesis